MAQKARRGRPPPVHLGKRRPPRPLSLAPSHRFTPDRDGQTPDHLPPGALPPLPRPGGEGGLCSPSGVPPPDCVRSVTRKPGLERRRARRGSRSPELKCPDHARRGAARHVRAALAGGRLSRAGGSRGLRRARWRRGRAGRGGARGPGAHVVPTVLPFGQVPEDSALLRMGSAPTSVSRGG